MMLTDSYRAALWLPLLLILAAGAGANTGESEPIPATGSAQARFGLHFEPVDFSPPVLNRATLDNGIPLVHFQEDESGLVTIQVQIRAGSIHDGEAKVGRASLTAEVIRTGGSGSIPGDDLDRLLDEHGAQLGASADRERTLFRLSILPEDAEWGIGLLHELLADPALPADKLAEEVGRRLVGLRQRLDVPASVGRALYPQLVFGKGNPWGWTETSRTLQSISIEDLAGFHRDHYHPGMMMLGISGAIGFERARELAGQSFGSLDRLEPPATALPAIEPIEASRVVIVPRPTTQNVLYVGHQGVGRFDPAKFPIKIFNSVLSGGFTSRLFSQVRTERGLAYSVWGTLGEGTVRGIYFNFAQTKVESTAEVLELMLDINRGLQREPPTPAEMELARQSEVNSFVFFFDTAEKMVSQQLMLDMHDYPADYLESYVDMLRGVEPEAVRQAAARHLRLDSVVVLLIGTVDDPLRQWLEEKIGPVSEISDEQLRDEWL